MAISEKKIKQLRERAESGQIMDVDIDAFMENPQLWRKIVSTAEQAPFTLEIAQAFWQGVYDELGIKVTVPALPTLTDKQKKSFDKFEFRPVYIPALAESEFPACFVKPGWNQYLNVASITRMPLKGKWVAVETIAKPHYDDGVGYANDRLMVAVGKTTRFNTSWDDLHEGGLLVEIAKVTGFPKKGTRLPTVEEWNFIANLFNWLREHRSMDLPDLSTTRSLEWCENACVADDRLLVGLSGHGGLADVGSGWRDSRTGLIAFRVLADL